MITLYARAGCPFCVRVLERLEELDIEFAERDIGDPQYLAELLEKGGKRQVPFLVDENRGVSMYESGDIIGYLNETYAAR